jgi:hypothetical protein
MFEVFVAPKKCQQSSSLSPQVIVALAAIQEMFEVVIIGGADEVVLDEEAVPTKTLNQVP